ncbi:hypothetical protein MRGA327_18915 [Mycobacterium tuberculosis RGTB327]|nr:hypothetical protein MRGA327_18915 [Mycobacterium tuberculosis RGTB327]
MLDGVVSDTRRSPDDSGPAANHLGRPGRLWFLEFMGRGRRPLLRLEPRSRRRSSRQHPPRAGRPQHAGGACHRVRPTHDTGLPHRGPARPAAQSHQPLDTTAGRSCMGGATVVTLTSTIEIGGNPLARLAELVVGRAMAKRSNTMLAGLAQRLEDKHG